MQPHRWQLTRLRRPWDSPGKHTGVGCHFLIPYIHRHIHIYLLTVSFRSAPTFLLFFNLNTFAKFWNGKSFLHNYVFKSQVADSQSGWEHSLRAGLPGPKPGSATAFSVLSLCIHELRILTGLYPGVLWLSEQRHTDAPQGQHGASRLVSLASAPTPSPLPCLPLSTSCHGSQGWSFFLSLSRLCYFITHTCNSTEVYHCCSVTQSCLTLCDPVDCSTPVLHRLPEFAQTHVHWVGNANRFHPLLPASPPALNLSQNRGLFHCVGSSHQVAKVLEFQLKHQSFQWTFRVDFLHDWLLWFPLMHVFLQSFLYLHGYLTSMTYVNNLRFILVFFPVLIIYNELSIHDLKGVDHGFPNTWDCIIYAFLYLAFPIQ